MCLSPEPLCICVSVCVCERAVTHMSGAQCLSAASSAYFQSQNVKMSETQPTPAHLYMCV